MSIQIAKHLKIKIDKKEENPREDCVIGKAKQSDIPKASEHVKSTMIGEKYYYACRQLNKRKTQKIQKCIGQLLLKNVQDTKIQNDTKK